ncbi:MAG: DUF4258 domain-containing protein [bacterium]|jgi:hypothetical protein
MEERKINADDVIRAIENGDESECLAENVYMVQTSVRHRKLAAVFVDRHSFLLVITVYWVGE